MKNHRGEKVLLQRGEAVKGEDGKVVVSGGNDFKRQTGTRSNYGLNKIIYKHGMSKAEVQKMPKYIKKRPAESNPYGQDIYIVRDDKGQIKVVTSTRDGNKTVSSMYRMDK